MSKSTAYILGGIIFGMLIGFRVVFIFDDAPTFLNIFVWLFAIGGGLLGKKLANWSPAPSNNSQYPPMPVFPYSTGSTHGTATWTNPELIDALFNDHNHDHYIDGGGYYIGEGRNLLPLLHGITVAGSGQGKNGTIITTNLLKRPAASWFVTDIKGENAKVSARWQQHCGQRVVILDAWGEQQRLKADHDIEPTNFNPLEFVQSNPDEMPELCGVVAEMLVPDSSAKEPYWESRARSLIKTYLLHLVTGRPEEERHLGTLYRWLRLAPRERQRLWYEMEENLECDELVKSGISEFIGMSDDNGPLPSIISTAQDNTSFLESAALRKSLMGSGFDPYDLTDGKTTVYLCLPERFLETHSRYLRLVVGVCLKACNHRPRPGKRINLLLDEFPILKRMPSVEKAFAFGRGQNISCWIFAQTLTQLIDIYGENATNALIANARLRQFFGVLDLPTQKYLSEYLGDTTIRTTTKSQSTSSGRSSGSSSGTNGGGSSSGTNWSQTESTNYQEISRRLLTVDEIGKMHDMITLIDGYKFLLARLPYWGSLYEAFVKGLYRYYPLTKEDWHYFIDQLRHAAPQAREDLGNTFSPRADDTKVLQLSEVDTEFKTIN